MIDNEHVIDLTAAYALGALSADQLRMVEAHCARCAACAADLAEMTGTASTLPLLCDPVAPSALLKRRILATAQKDVSAGRLVRGPQLARSRPAAWWPAAAAAGFVAAAGLGGWGMVEHQRAVAQSARMADQAAQMEAMRGQVATSRTAIADIASGRVWDLSGGSKAHWWHCTVVQPAHQKKAMLVALMPPAPKGKTFQMWIIRGGKVHDAGTVPAGTTTMMHMPMPVRSGDVVAFTLEPMGGSATPTLPAAMEQTLE